jgi:succinoglycan biosynthesis protein ExoM
MASTNVPHISVCACTYKRPELLKRLLEELVKQETNNLFTFSVVVADNDQAESAKKLVSEFAATSALSIRYCVEPRQNIALARNTAIANATGDLIAFIDDDEFPSLTWLLTLFNAWKQYEAAGVLGPVRPYFPEGTPKWVVRGKFYERTWYPTGHVINWEQGRTGNVLLHKSIFEGDDQPFNPAFRSGSDQDFFRRMIAKGYSFIWCNEAIAYEIVPPIRWKRRFMCRRALLSGTNSSNHPSFGASEIVKSVIAIPTYIMALPFALIIRQDWFMQIAVKLFNHLGKLLRVLGVNAVRDAYVTD